MIDVGVVRAWMPIICKARPDRKADSFSMRDTAGLEGVAELLHIYPSSILNYQFDIQLSIRYALITRIKFYNVCYFDQKAVCKKPVSSTCKARLQNWWSRQSALAHGGCRQEAHRFFHICVIGSLALY